MVALPLRLYVGGVTILINISVQAPRCLIMSIYKHRITSTVKRNIVRQGYDSDCQKQIWEHPPRVMRSLIGWYVCHPSLGCSRFRMAAFSLMESLGGYGGQKTPSIIPFNPCVWHNFGCTTAELYNAPLGHFFLWARGFQRLYRTQSTPKLTCELMNW